MCVPPPRPMAHTPSRVHTPAAGTSHHPVTRSLSGCGGAPCVRSPWGAPSPGCRRGRQHARLCAGGGEDHTAGATGAGIPPPPVAWPPVVGSRRDTLLAGLALVSSLLSPTAAWADDDSDTADAEAQMRSVLAKQPAISGFTTLTATLAGGGLLLSFDVPASWTQGPQSSGMDGDGFQYTTWGGLVDPVLGPIAVEATLRTRPVPEGVTSVRDLGGDAKSQADVLPVKAFNLASAVPELARADITRAGARVGSVPVSTIAKPSSSDASEAGAPDEPLFWEWELAVPPESCAYNTGCNSSAVHFVSLAVVAGQLCWLDLKLTDETAYRNAAGQLRRARTSFTAVPAPPPPPPRGASQAEAAVIVAAP